MSMKRYSIVIFGSALFLTAWTSVQANAQAPAGTPESHVAAARAVAYKPGQDFTWVFDQNCKEPAPRSAQPRAAAQPAATPAAPKVPPRSEWFYEPVKVFDNLYYVGSQLQSMWVV